VIERSVTITATMALPRFTKSSACLPLIGLAALSACTVGYAPPPAGLGPPPAVAGHPDMTGWRLMGDGWAAGTFEREFIHVGKYEGRVARVMLVVMNSNLEIGDVVIQFGSGQRLSPGLRHEFADGSRSRPIELPGHVRFIRGVELVRGVVEPGGRAHIEIWGQ